MTDSDEMDTPEKPRLLTPSKVTAWLDCPHYLTLAHGGHRATNGGPGEFARLLMDKGLEHERACLRHYEASGKTVRVVADRPKGADFGDWVERVGAVLAEGDDVIYQMPFVHNGMRGIADFLLKVELPDGTFTYEPLDAKLARKEAKPGHVLQLCFYADAIEAAGFERPKHVHIWLGSGRIESIRLHEVVAYWRRLQRQLKVAMEPAPDAPPTEPVRCDHCAFCEFASGCEQVWREADALQFVAGIRRAEIEKLEADAVVTMAALAVRVDEVPDLQPERQVRLVSQSALQVQAREMPEGSIPPHHPLPDPTPEETSAGMAALPAPDDGDVFLDYEGHPFWRADRGLFFLFGLLTKANGAWTYEARWAHDEPGEGREAKALIEYFAVRRGQFPGMHVYHYNHTERSALEAMAAEHGADQTLLQELVETGLFVDLLSVVRNSLQAGVESYGLKSMEQIAQYERNHEIDKGAGAVVGYERFMKTKDESELTAIAVYNEDDVRATLALREWLLTQRDAALEWRLAVFETESKYPEIDEQVAALLEFDGGTPEHLMGDLLGYWLREGRANTAKLLAKLDKDTDALGDDQEAIVGLEFLRTEVRHKKDGQPRKWPRAVFRYPPQIIGTSLDPERADRPPKVCHRIDEATVGWLIVDTIDTVSREVGFEWGEKAQERGEYPSNVVLNTWVSPDPKPEALSAIAGDLLEGKLAPSVTDALLRAEPPRFVGGHGPVDGRFTDDLDDICRWVQHLDHSCVAIQGPPGTGKTFTGAHIVHALVSKNKRVGITAMSHAAIDNLLHEVEKIFDEKGDLGLLNAVRRGKQPATPDAAWLTIATANQKCAKAEFNVVAGTTWLFAGDDMVDAKVDVLIIDEAGQLGLADALAASRAAHNIVLLGDPLQLAQVSQATHPDGAGASVLEHAIGLENATVPDHRGVFLTESRRMHPHVCTFISDEIYDGRLTSFSDCAKQGTAKGTGLRWLQAHHEGSSTESVEEVAMVIDAISGLVGTQWTDSTGTEPIDFGAEHVMVVAPYNDQVRLLRSSLDAAGLSRVRAGTVDKFQGQQAPVVFFTMTSSSSDDMPRDADFLFSRNRLNVALSRAKCLAYVVCTEELLNSRARDVDTMRLISTLCAAVDYAMCAPLA